MNILHALAQCLVLILLGILLIRGVGYLRGWASLDGPGQPWPDVALAVFLPCTGLVAVWTGLWLRDGLPASPLSALLLRAALAALPGCAAVLVVPRGPSRAIALAVVGFAALAGMTDLRFAQGEVPRGPAALLLGLVLAGATAPALVAALAARPLAIGAAGLLLLALTWLVGVGPDGCRDCPHLALGLSGLSIQSFALAKIALILAVAAVLAREIGRPFAWRDHGRWSRQAVILLGAAACLWVLNRDLGPILVVGAVAAALLLLVHLPEQRRGVAVGLILAGVYAFGLAMAASATFRDRLNEISGRGAPSEQLAQAWYAIGFGGLLGHGLGRVRLGSVPLVSTDLILVAIVAELGLFGTLLALALGPLLAAATTHIARRYLERGDPLRGLALVGCGLLPVIQTLVIVGGVLKVVPLTGIPWPGVSRGASDLLALGGLLGLALRLARGPILPMRPAGAVEGYVAADLARLPRRLGALTLPIVAMLAYVTLWAGPRLSASPRYQAIPDPHRANEVLALLGQASGTAILARDGTPLAFYRDGRFEVARDDLTCLLGLPGPSGAPIGGLGEEWLDVMAGARPAVDSWGSRLQRLADGRSTPVSLVTTIDPQLQEIASRALARMAPGEEGTIVIVDREGGVVAMACAPSVEAHAADNPASWAAAAADPRHPFLPRATLGLYACGSVCKLLTYTAALEHGVLGGVGTPLSYPNGGECPHVALLDGTYQLTSPYYCGRERVRADAAFAISDNLLAGLLGLRLGADRLDQTARTLGFGQPALRDVPAAASTLWPSRDQVSSERDLAWLAAGQGTLQVTPAQIAALAAIGLRADGGVPRLHVVRAVRSSGGDGETPLPPPASARLRPATAQGLRQLMLTSVETGWARPAGQPGIVAGGKTGTAEYGDPVQTHAWYGGFFELPGGRDQEEGYAIAVLIANGGEGSRAAGLAGAIADEWARR